MLLAVAMFALWVAGERNYVRQRRAAMEEIGALGGGVWLAEDVADEVARLPTIPLWRRLMGDVAVAQLLLPPEYLGHTANHDRITALFPETVRPERPPFDVVGKLSPDDMREIWSVVRDYCQEHNIREPLLGIAAEREGEVEVDLGEQRGPLDGGGTILRLQRKDGEWKIVDRGVWISRSASPRDKHEP